MSVEGTVATKSHFDRSDLKRTLEYVAKIEIRSNNVPPMSIKAIGVSDCLIRQVAQDDIRYSPYKRRKNQFLS